MKKVVFLIRSINIGGAERQLLTLLKGIDRKVINPVVVTFYPGGDLLSEFTQADIKVISASKKYRWDIFSFLMELLKVIRELKPDTIVSFLVAANLLAICLKPFLHSKRLIISIRHSFIRENDYDFLSRIMYFLQDKLASTSDRIIINSYTGAYSAIKRGIPEKKVSVISNGIDTSLFHPNKTYRNQTRKMYKIHEKAPVVGIIGRIDPIKDHETFIKAASIVFGKRPDVFFMIVGSGDSGLEGQLKTLIGQMDLGNRIIWTGPQKDLVGIYNSLDFLVSASIGEGFSNVICEAMACEKPCVVTDVGDSALIVGDTGVVVPVGAPEDMANAIIKLLDLSEEKQKEIGMAARNRIMSEFSVEKMVATTTMEILNLR